MANYTGVKKIKIGNNTFELAGIKTLTVTLTGNGWNNFQQSVTATGVTANNTVIVAPAPESYEVYGGAGIYCSAQAANSLTFKCASVPSDNITVNVGVI